MAIGRHDDLRVETDRRWRSSTKSFTKCRGSTRCFLRVRRPRPRPEISSRRWAMRGDARNSRQNSRAKPPGPSTGNDRYKGELATSDCGRLLTNSAPGTGRPSGARCWPRSMRPDLSFDRCGRSDLIQTEKATWSSRRAVSFPSFRFWIPSL